MVEDLIELYKKLSLNDKRNEFSSLLLKVDKLLDELVIKSKLSSDRSVKNYDSSTNNNMSESDMLAFFYEDLWNIKNKVLTLLVADTEELK